MYEHKLPRLKPVVPFSHQGVARAHHCRREGGLEAEVCYVAKDVFWDVFLLNGICLLSESVSTRCCEWSSCDNGVMAKLEGKTDSQLDHTVPIPLPRRQEARQPDPCLWTEQACPSAQHQLQGTTWRQNMSCQPCVREPGIDILLCRSHFGHIATKDSLENIRRRAVGQCSEDHVLVSPFRLDPSLYCRLLGI